MHRTRINLANPQELLELPGIRQAEADAIIRHRAQHGPISDAAELMQILGPGIVTPAYRIRMIFRLGTAAVVIQKA